MLLDGSIDLFVFVSDWNAPDTRFQVHIALSRIIKKIGFLAVNNIWDFQFMSGAAINVFHKPSLCMLTIIFRDETVWPVVANGLFSATIQRPYLLSKLFENGTALAVRWTAWFAIAISKIIAAR